MIISLIYLYNAMYNKIQEFLSFFSLNNLTSLLIRLLIGRFVLFMFNTVALYIITLPLDQGVLLSI